MSTIEELKNLREWEDHIEFKRAQNNYPFTGGSKKEPAERRRCVLGYIVALANERGGRLVLGMEDSFPHHVTGSNFAEGRLGQIEDDIYELLHIRVKTEELHDEQNRRVVVFNVPSRPLGKALRFEGVPLMRVGESLREMDDAEYLNIISEQDPDFSAKECSGLSLDDLDEAAITEMRTLLSQKRGSDDALSTPLVQLLTDLELMVNGKLNNAALILLGKTEAIRQHLPQDNVVVEYRLDHSQMRYSAREEFCGPLFLVIKQVWNYLNQPTSNPLRHIELLPQIIDIPSFNHETVREALINALIHRSMQMVGDIMIRQYPDSLIITNPGGFPFGVSLSNILTVNSSPRSRRLAEVIEKAGLIERSGQGVDIMFSNCITEGKNVPDYSASDEYQVSLKLSATITHPELYLLIRDCQQPHSNQRLNTFDLVTLYNILERNMSMLFTDSLPRLLEMGLIEKDPDYHYVMSDLYYTYMPAVKTGLISATDMRLLSELFTERTLVEMNMFVKKFTNKTPRQTRLFVDKCCKQGLLVSEGRGRGTKYRLGPQSAGIEVS